MSLAGALSHKGEFEAAIQEFEKIAASDVGGPDAVLAPLVIVYARAGRRKEAMKALADFRAMAAREGVSDYVFANVLMSLGEKEEALTRLESALNQRDPALTDIKIDAAFGSLVQRVGLPP
jgi:tetratricopeptide (TPR) repeat protein